MAYHLEPIERVPSCEYLTSDGPPCGKTSKVWVTTPWGTHVGAYCKPHGDTMLKLLNDLLVSTERR